MPVRTSITAGILAAGLVTGLGADQPANSAAAAAARVRSRIDINPALLYWQAYSLLPELSEADNRRAGDRHLAKGDKETADLVARFDASFKVVQRARGMTAVTDWGVDLSMGPDAMLPQLAKAKRIAQASTFRANYFLSIGRETNAIDEYLGALTLGRHVASDAILICPLVQMAIDNIVLSAVAENFHRLGNESLVALRAGLDGLPLPVTISQCIATEKYAFIDWYIERIKEIEARTANRPAVALEEIRKLFRSTMSENQDTNFVEKIVAEAGGTTAGMIRYLDGSSPLYARISEVVALPYPAYQQEIAALTQVIEKEGNGLVKTLFPAVPKCRDKELAAQIREAMVRAAIAYRLQGAAGFKQVLDPVVGGSFAFRRVTVEGIDRGFEVGSRFTYRNTPEVLIFIETPGTPFRVDGPKAGTPIEVGK